MIEDYCILSFFKSVDLMAHTHKRPGKERVKKSHLGTSLVAQWLRIRLPMQGTRVQALVQEDPTCRKATKPMLHNY